MEIKYVEEKKDEIVFDVVGVTHGFCNLLKEELVKDKNVELATYKIDHPLVGIPRFKVIASDGKAAVKKAIKSIRKQVEEFKADAKKIK